MARLVQIMPNRSLTLSVVTLVFSVLSLGCTLSFAVRARFAEDHFPVGSVLVLFGSIFLCTLTLVGLRRDQKSGYSSSRLSVAILLWGLACFPIVLLLIAVAREILRFMR